MIKDDINIQGQKAAFMIESNLIPVKYNLWLRVWPMNQSKSISWREPPLVMRCREAFVIRSSVGWDDFNFLVSKNHRNISKHVWEEKLNKCLCVCAWRFSFIFHWLKLMHYESCTSLCWWPSLFVGGSFIKVILNSKPKVSITGQHITKAAGRCCGCSCGLTTCL